MAIKSRRKAREGALRVLYEVEIGGAHPEDAFERMLEDFKLSAELTPYAKRLVFGILEDRLELDEVLSSTVHGYDFGRLAAIDRNVLRIGAFELRSVAEVPPAVSIDEAIEIARKYSTVESGKFVNGVLGAILAQTDRGALAHALQSFEAEERDPEPEPEVEERVVAADSSEAQIAARFAGWKLKAE